MKPLSVNLKLIAVTTISLACLGTFSAFAAEGTGDPVTIEQDRILIPGTNISESDQRAVNAILAKYDKSLYKLKGYVNGKAGKQQGTLKDAMIDKVTAARAAVHAKDAHFSGWTLQIGSTTNQNSNANPGTTTNQNSNAKPGTTTNQNSSANPSPSPKDGSKDRELVKRLTPILQKYTKAQSKR